MGVAKESQILRWIERLQNFYLFFCPWQKRNKANATLCGRRDLSISWRLEGVKETEFPKIIV